MHGVGGGFVLTIQRAQAYAVAMALCVTVLTAAQGPPPVRAPRTLRSSVEVTAVTVTVRDGDGRLVTGLPREAFSVYEDGELQEITQFTHERVPVALGLLLDVSDSMFGERIRDARGAVARFLLELLSTDDVFFLMAFNHAPHVLTPWTSDPEIVADRARFTAPVGRDRDLRCGRGSAAAHRQPPRDRAALVVISDGADTASDVTLRDLRASLLRTDAFIYAIAIDSQARQAINTRVNPEALAEITNQSGGRTEVVHDTTDLGPATARIAEELNNQYVLGYSSPRPGDGKYHAIRVTVSGPGYKVRARNGYVAARRS